MLSLVPRLQAGWTDRNPAAASWYFGFSASATVALRFSSTVGRSALNWPWAWRNSLISGSSYSRKMRMRRCSSPSRDMSTRIASLPFWIRTAVWESSKMMLSLG